MLILKRFLSEILPPQSRKWKKVQRGRIPVPVGGSLKGRTLEFGDYGMRVREGTILTLAQLESARKVLAEHLKKVKGGQMFLRTYPNLPITKKPLESRMGKGKGEVDHYGFRAGLHKIVFEVKGTNLKWHEAKYMLWQAGQRLPGRGVDIVRRVELLPQLE